MKVIFKKQYFGPNSRRYRAGVEYDVPDEWFPKLPTGAKVLDEAPPAPTAEPSAPKRTRSSALLDTDDGT